MTQPTPGYLIGSITLHDPEAYTAYTSRVSALVAAAGGTYLVRGGDAEVLEGDDGTERNVVIQFPSVEAARAFYNSAAYQEIIPFRTAASTGRLILVEGVNPQI